MARPTGSTLDVPLDAAGWSWGREGPTLTELLGRRCLAFPDTLMIATLADVKISDGAVELDLAVTRERSFHGLVWRLVDDESHEAFFVRPHQVGNPDAIQYTPVFHGVSGWQLYHGPGFGAPVTFPIDAWFTVRVVFAGSRAEVYVADLATPALVVAELKRGSSPGRIGLQVGGPGLHVAGFRYEVGPISLGSPGPAPVARAPGVIPAWSISDPIPEEEYPGAPVLDRSRLDARTWTTLEAEPSGLADLARVTRLTEARNTVFARTTIRSAVAALKVLELGFSDRVVVYLNGQALYRGNDTYRSRDYRFLGSIGYWDALFLPLRSGDNELVLAVSETFGGWGVQARFPDPEGLELGPA
ncbi:MAG: hypothetical protein EPO36_05265 [Chloroflexota bacterium]|nr:MAG: hypothetical protein EPO36_05265 [Chloroflexota bacterium]